MELPLAKYKQRLKQLEQELQKPEVVSNPELMKKLSREYSKLKTIADVSEQLDQKRQELEEFEELIKETEDEAEKQQIETEISTLKHEIEQLENKLLEAVVPPDPDDSKNAIMEIRAGTGGEEAALFAMDLFKMYLKYAESKGWKINITDLHETELGGIREATLLIEGKGVYGDLKYESGVHRVQRVPITESGGRIHTSSASVVVMPEAPELEIEIKPEDLKIETFRAGGPGGQYVNVTDSAVRITHIPTGISVSCQDERSQHKNKQKALRILKARLKDKFERDKIERESQLRRSYIGTGDRSEKIRTYNFPQNRVTDHRIGLTLYALDRIMEGKIHPVIEALKRSEKLKRLEEIFKAHQEIKTDH